MRFLETLSELLRHKTPGQLARDALDIAIVYYLVYRALLVLKGTRALQVVLGLASLFAVWLLAQAAQLGTVLTLVNAALSSLFLILVIVFQADIRRWLMRLGSRAWFGTGPRQEAVVIDEVVKAATELARHRVGAIIALEQEANLDEFVGVNKGRTLDAAVSSELLVSLFVPEAMNELHDGAVVIRNLRIAKAGVFFPMPDVRVMDQGFGSRHRAALGITEETDAVVVVVSEERGTISFCFNGNIASGLDGPKLRTMLEAIFAPKPRRRRRLLRARDAAPPSTRDERPSLDTLIRITVAPEEEAVPPSRRAGRPAEPESLAPLRARDADSTGRHSRIDLEGAAPAPLRKARPVETPPPERAEPAVLLEGSPLRDEAAPPGDEPPPSGRGAS